MKKTELISILADKTGVNKKDVEKVMDSFQNFIIESLAKNEKVTLTGFGTFEVVQKKSRLGINPQTGETLKIPAKKFPKFKAGKKLKEVVNN